MPLDNASYALAFLRLDGRRWNELRRIHAQVSTQAAADGSSYLEIGNTKVICTVSGPAEGKRAGASRSEGNEAVIEAEINFAGFSGMERKRRTRGDKRTAEMQHTLVETFSHTLLTQLYPYSTIAINIHVLSQDGSILAACINAATLALIDAGIPMIDYVVACTVGLAPTSISIPSVRGQTGNTSGAASDSDDDPLLDVNSLEEQELPFMTVGTLGATDQVCCLMMESRVRIEKLETMMAVAVDGCAQMRTILDGIVKAHGKRLLDGSIK